MQSSTVDRRSCLDSWTPARGAGVVQPVSHVRRRLAVLCGVFFVCQLHAATFFVTTTSDSDILVPAGSLRQAISDANAALGPDTIQILVAGTIVLATNLPPVTDSTTILGPGSELLGVSGANLFPVLCLGSGTSNLISGLTIADGSLSNRFNYSQLWCGAGISNAGALKMLGCTVSNCVGQNGYGAGVYNAGQLDMEGCVVTDCAPAFPPYELLGGGVFTGGTLQMKNCRVSRCSAYHNGAAGDGVYCRGGGSVAMTNCLIESCRGGHPNADGGGLGNLGAAELDSCTISNCSGYWGGAVASYGTGVFANSTFVNNSANFGGGFVFGGTNAIANSTLSGNIGSIYGGAAYVYSGELTLASSTICSNTSGYFGGGVYNSAAGTVTSLNSILAWNSPDDFCGSFLSQGHNLIHDTNDCVFLGNATGNLLGLDPRLGPLTNNGGSTFTHALMRLSPAIDQGMSGGWSKDQRGAPRPYDVSVLPNASDGSDIGAFEWLPPTVRDIGTHSGEGRVRIRFAGVAGCLCHIERGLTLSGPWEPIGVGSTGPNGMGCFEDPDPPSGGAFYRATCP